MKVMFALLFAATTARADGLTDLRAALAKFPVGQNFSQWTATAVALR
jgi:hypothetical protein